jgi:alanyl-tRNA synthetase
MSSARDVGGVKVITAVVDGADGARLRQMGDMVKDKEPAVAAVLASVSGGKITFLAVCGKDAVSRGVKAGDIIKHVTAICGGKGGGKPDSAMGGGTDVGKLDEALTSVSTFLERKVAKEL